MEGQLGLEPTPEEYVNKLVSVFREVRRVLRKDGTLWLNLGDSYAGSSKGIGSYPDVKWPGARNDDMKHKTDWKHTNLKPKDLVGIPWRVAFALQIDGWYLRSDIIWAKPNPMPESVKDRPTKAHEYIFLLSKSHQYYFDHESIKEPAVGFNNCLPAGSEGAFGTAQSRRRKGNAKTFRGGGAYTGGKSFYNSGTFERGSRGNTMNESGLRACRDVWTVSTRPFKGAHFAVFPPDLARPCILAGCPVGGQVIDPFGGSGTVAMVASELGRDSIYIDLNPDYTEMARKRGEST